MDSTWVMIISLIILAVTIITVIGIYAKRYERVPPNKAMVVFGRKIGKDAKRGYRIITGGGKFIVPIIEAVDFLPLDVRTLDLNVVDIVTDTTKSGAKLNVRAVTQIKISSEQASLHVAAEQLLGKTNAEINEIATKTLEAHVRGICSKMTIEQVNSDRETVSEKIQSIAVEDLKNMGIQVISFAIKELEDEHGYLDALGMKRTAEVKRDARIGEAVANREATIKEAENAQEGEKANAEAEAQVATFHRDRDITKQKAETEVERERANREIAFKLQDAKRQQELIVEQAEIERRDKEKRVQVQAQEALRVEQEKRAQLVVPAEAQANAIAAEADGIKRQEITLAEAEQQKLVLIAEGESQSRKLVADGEASKITKEGFAEADVIEAKGKAEASAIKAKGLAEAEAMEKKAEAWKKYGQAAITEIIVEKLPAIAREVSLPLQGVDKMIIMGNEGQSGLVNKGVDIMAQLPALVKQFTGMDMTEALTAMSEAVGIKEQTTQAPTKPAPAKVPSKPANE